MEAKWPEDKVWTNGIEVILLEMTMICHVHRLMIIILIMEKKSVN